MSEFALIDAIRARMPVARGDVALGMGDDAALLEPAPGSQLVACVDTMVAGVHFTLDADASDIGWKALAVNLSDMAAMGAEPAWAMLALTLPTADAGFVDGFMEGFGALAVRHGVDLVGGDTTQGPLAASVTLLGTVPRGQAVTRGGAKAGDAVFVTGTLGDAAASLRLPYPSPAADARDAERGFLRKRHDRPRPQVAMGRALRGVATACIDVSDGLLADLGHLCTASGVRAEIDVDVLPVSPQLRALFDANACRELALAGGDDYELCFSLPAARVPELEERLAAAGGDATRIGQVAPGSGVRVTDSAGHEVKPACAGWEHFSR